MSKIGFTEFYDLHKKYKIIFNEIFDMYYEKGYFGAVSKAEVRISQYKWFCKLIEVIESKQDKILEPFVANHNNKITREYYSKVTGINLKRKKKTDIIELFKCRY
jgi:hypothetical protein